jgi:hypothetical protein
VREPNTKWAVATLSCLYNRIWVPIHRLHVFADTGSALNNIKAKRNLGAAYLLVCKIWPQVGTPVVYETVILNSAAQAYEFRISLINTPLLGSLVRKLRIHRGFGGHMQEILPRCPQITDLYLSLRISLPLVQPTRVIVQDPFYAIYLHASLGRLYSKIYSCIPMWKRLVSNLLRFVPHTVQQSCRKSFIFHVYLLECVHRVILCG